MEKKYIHYCWFGGKPLPKMAKKCLESWKKFLPDYEIIRWDETNSNLEECEFVKGAYSSKKWAFVADYIRTKALYEYGGIYLDTDMELTREIYDLLEKGSFLGVEDSAAIAVGVWYEKEKHGFLPNELLKKYRSFEEFEAQKVADFSIPKLITEILLKHGFKYYKKDIQKITIDDYNIYIYPREYFYPYSYDWNNNKFTENTRMIHYYDASWVNFKDKLEINLVRKFGRKRGTKIIHAKWKLASLIKKIIKIPLYPLVLLRRCYKKIKENNTKVSKKYLTEIDQIIKDIESYKDKEYIVLHNKNFLGVTHSTKELFENTIHCGELYRNKDINKIAEKIANTDIKQVIFSSLSFGQYKIIIKLKQIKPEIKIKCFWHGSHSQIQDEYGFDRLTEIIELNRQKKVDAFATCKKSLYNFYKSQDLDVFFLTNKVVLPKELKKEIENNNLSQNREKLQIGLYGAGFNIRKNMVTQLASLANMENVVVDIVPLDESISRFCDLIGVECKGEKNSLTREELIKRMAQNDVNLYVTYSECAPMLPLESLEVGVPCISGNNHHYFEGMELKELIVVDDESSTKEIYKKIELCIKNKEKINELYADFRKKNISESNKLLEEFLKY